MTGAQKGAGSGREKRTLLGDVVVVAVFERTKVILGAGEKLNKSVEERENS